MKLKHCGKFKKCDCGGGHSRFSIGDNVYALNYDFKTKVLIVFPEILVVEATNCKVEGSLKGCFVCCFSERHNDYLHKLAYDNELFITYEEALSETHRRNNET